MTFTTSLFPLVNATHLISNVRSVCDFKDSLKIPPKPSSVQYLYVLAFGGTLF